MNRREFLIASASVLSARAASAQQPRTAVRPVPRVVPGRNVLLKGGVVLSLDPKVSDFDAAADPLIEGSKIAAVGPNLKDVPAHAVVIDASWSNVMPGGSSTRTPHVGGPAARRSSKRQAQRLHARYHRRCPCVVFLPVPAISSAGSGRSTPA